MEERICVVKYKRGGIYYLNAPRIREGEDRFPGMQLGTRPILIISNDKFNIVSDVISYVPLTTTIRNDIETRVTIRIDQKISQIECEQVYTVSKNYVSRFVGTLEDYKMKEVEKKLASHLNLRSSISVTQEDIINILENYTNKIQEKYGMVSDIESTIDKLLNKMDNSIKEAAKSYKTKEDTSDTSDDVELAESNKEKISEPTENRRHYIFRSPSVKKDIIDLYSSAMIIKDKIEKQKMINDIVKEYNFSSEASLKKFYYNYKNKF